MTPRTYAPGETIVVPCPHPDPSTAEQCGLCRGTLERPEELNALGAAIATAAANDPALSTKEGGE